MVLPDGAISEPARAADYSIAVVVRAIDILEALADASEPLGATEIARRVGTTKTAAYRILATLEQRDYVTKDPASSRYRLGIRLAYLGGRSLESLELTATARSTMEALNRRFRETVNLGVLRDGKVAYLDMIESDQGLRIAALIGTRDHLHSTALGKAILAFLPPEQREELLRLPRPRMTVNTITDRRELNAELARVRRSGVAEDLGENDIGVRCLGAPIFDHSGLVVAAISLSGPGIRIDDERAAEIGAAVTAAGREISRRLGAAPTAEAAAGGT